MPVCAVLGCRSVRKQRRIHYFRVPEDPTLRQQWLEACGRRVGSFYAKPTICSKHFEMSQFLIPSGETPGKRFLKDDAVPTLELPKTKEDGQEAMAVPSLVERAGFEAEGEVTDSSISSELLTTSFVVTECDSHKLVHNQTRQLQAYLAKLTEERDRMKNENQKLLTPLIKLRIENAKLKLEICEMYSGTMTLEDHLRILN